MISRIFIALVLLSSVGLFAQPPMVDVEQIECIPTEFNGLIKAAVKPDVGGSIVRLYFRWEGHGAFYFTDMFSAGGGRYWGLTARPEERNELVEYYVEVIDPTIDLPEAPLGRVLARSKGNLTAPVADDCNSPLYRCTDPELSADAQLLCSQQYGAANNLTVGETVMPQEGRGVLGFLCDGLVTRVNYQGIMRPDEMCRGCVIPWWLTDSYIAPAAAALGATTLITVDTDPSPSRPSCTGPSC